MTECEKRDVLAAEPWTCDECDKPVAPGERFCSQKCADLYGRWIERWVRDVTRGILAAPMVRGMR